MEIDLTDTTAAEKHEACNEDMVMFEEENCWDSGAFQESEIAVEIPEDRGEISEEVPSFEDLGAPEAEPEVALFRRMK